MINPTGVVNTRRITAKKVLMVGLAGKSPVLFGGNNVLLIALTVLSITPPIVVVLLDFLSDSIVIVLPQYSHLYMPVFDAFILAPHFGHSFCLIAMRNSFHIVYIFIITHFMIFLSKKLIRNMKSMKKTDTFDYYIKEINNIIEIIVDKRNIA